MRCKCSFYPRSLIFSRRVNQYLRLFTLYFLCVIQCYSVQHMSFFFFKRKWCGEISVSRFLSKLLVSILWPWLSFYFTMSILVFSLSSCLFLFFLLFYKLVLSVSLFFVLCLPDVDGGNESCEARFTAIGDGPFFYYFYISISLIISFFCCEVLSYMRIPAVGNIRAKGQAGQCRGSNGGTEPGDITSEKRGRKISGERVRRRMEARERSRKGLDST